MLSAAAAATLAAAVAVSAARADTEISTATTTALATATAGNIVIDATGTTTATGTTASSATVSIQTSGVAAVTLNSNNYVLNNGGISNANIDSGIGVSLDTSGGNILSTNGFTSTGTVDLSGNGTGKLGLIIQGGNTFYGPISLSSLISTSLTGTSAATQASSIVVQGDSSAAIYLVQGTKVTSNILIGGGGILQNASVNSTASNSVLVDLDGTLNGNLLVASALNGVGPGIIGIETLGGIHSCASDTNAPAGFSCPSSSGGTFYNSGTISLAGTSTPSTRGNNPEAGSAIIVGGSIDGGFVNAGPGTSSTITSAVLSAPGIIAAGTTQPTVLIDPSLSQTGTATTPRGAVVIGPVTADVDGIDPGYSFINRGNILARPIDNDLSTGALVIQGASAVYSTCLSTVVGSCSTTPTAASSTVGVTVNGVSTPTTVNYTALGGLLDTGSITASATTSSAILTASGITSATGVYIGSFATVPRIDVKSEAVSASTGTAGTISAQVSGIGQGSAFGLILGTNSNVPLLNVGLGAKITASVITSTISPTASTATITAPFSLVSEAIEDQGGSLKTINNAGTIQAVNTVLTPEANAVTSSTQRAIDLSSATAGGIVINNSGKILGDVLFGASGNSDILNVGNVSIGGTTGNANLSVANGGLGVVTNTPANYAVVAGTIVSTAAGSAPSTTFGQISFGSGTSQQLNVGAYGYVNAAITSASGGLAVTVYPNGQLFVANTNQALQASTFVVQANGTLGLAISQTNLNSLTPVVQANSANLNGANLGLQFGTYISSGFTAAAVASPTAQTITLIQTPLGQLTDLTLTQQSAQLGQNTPFLFESPASAGEVTATSTYKADNGPTPLTIENVSGSQDLLLHLLPRSVNATNADGSPGLNLSGSAKYTFPFAAAALSNDTQLGAAIASSLTVYNTAGVPSSGINVKASQQQAQQVFSQFAPDVSGGTREIAILLTDEATGPVGARQRLLRSMSDQPGDTTLWGQEFTGQINNKGQLASDGSTVSYKDHGFGFALGLDGGSPRNGWYGGAFTFYTGDVTQQLPRNTRDNTQWYMLTGYTDWKGRHVFLDTQISAAYGNFQESRDISVGGIIRESDSKRPAALVALGANTGMMFHWAGVELDPHVSLDGLTLREEGYDEANGGPGLNLDVAPYYASSVRTAIGTDLKTSVPVFGINLVPEARIGYRYDLLQQAVKIKAAFDSTGGLGTAGNTMTFVGPDPDSGNTVLGLSLGAHTDTWELGVNYDWVRGNNASTTQVGTITILGRI